MQLHVVNLVNYGCQGIFTGIYYHSILTPRWNRRWTFLWVFLLQLIMGLFGYYIIFDWLFRTPFLILLSFLIVFVFYKDNISRKLLYFILNMFLSLTSDVIMTTISSDVFHISLNAMRTTQRGLLVSLFLPVQFFLYATVIFLVKRTQVRISPKLMLQYCIPPFLQLFPTTVTLIFVYRHYEELPDLLVYLLLVLTIFSCAYFLYMLATIAAKTQLEMNNAFLNRQMQQQYHSYLTLKEHMADTSKYRHDIYNHMQAVKHLVESGNTERASRYLNEMTEKFNSIDIKVNSGDPVIDAISNCKYLEFCQAGIEWLADFRLTERVTIPEIDLVSVISNLLDNAIEAAAVSEQKQVDWQCYTRCGMLIVQVHNTVSFSDKRAVKSTDSPHGLGVSIVEEICHKYGGRLEIEKRVGSFTATACMELPVPLEDAASSAYVTTIS